MKLRVCVIDTLTDKNWSSSGPILLLIFTIELHYVLESVGVFYHCFAADPQNYFTFESITEAESKHGVIFNKVDG